ncbi:hypothetical protein ZIOFF_010404 [Zingiber officinale]|uniref:Fiber protein Fb34 n=1 Tax=Zingiber officinale TaxID=94328 RepID=A0A8J5HJ50_ZINOF|nr:hypothetical protein ZIOFF_010404 [Zingiber officinale]
MKTTQAAASEQSSQSPNAGEAPTVHALLLLPHRRRENRGRQQVLEFFLLEMRDDLHRARLLWDSDLELDLEREIGGDPSPFPDPNILLDYSFQAVQIEVGRLLHVARVVSDSEDNYNYCVYDSDIATGYGVGALLFLLLSHAILMILTNCLCFGRRSLAPGGPRACTLLLFLLSTVTFIIAEACLLAGSVRNAHHTRYRNMFFDGDLSCDTVRKGVFAAGAAFVFFTALLTELYYIFYSKAVASDELPYGSGAGAVGMSSFH